MLRSLIVICLVLLIGPAAAAAEVWPSLDSPPTVARAGVHDVAVLVAVEDYLFVPDVAGAQQNLREWEVFLRDGLGVPTITTLVNEQATREEMLAAAESAARLASPEGTVWFLFVGHGSPTEQGDGMLVGVDTQQTTRSLAARGVTRGELLERLQAGPQRRTVVVLDACFSGRLPDGEALVPGTQPLIPVDSNVGVDEHTVLLTAAQANEFAGPMPGLARPAFSYLVLGGLRGWADDGDGAVTADEAVMFARRELMTVPGRRQTPTIVGLTSMVLTEDAREARPPEDERSVAATVDQPSIGARSDVGPRDLIGDGSRLFASVGVGAGAETTYETGTLLVDALVGVRLTTLRRPTRFGLVGGLGYANVTNVLASELEGAVNTALSDSGYHTTINVADRTNIVRVGVGPSMEVKNGPVRFIGDFRGSLALGSECQEWDFDETLTATSCTRRETVATPAVGARLAISYRLFELAAQATFMSWRYEVPDAGEASKTLFVAGATFGATFDL